MTRTRMTLDMSKRAHAELERLATERGVSKAETLRFAIELFSSAERAKEEGFSVGAWSSDHRREVEFVGRALAQTTTIEECRGFALILVKDLLDIMYPEPAEPKGEDG